MHYCDLLSPFRWHCLTWHTPPTSSSYHLPSPQSPGVDLYCGAPGKVLVAASKSHFNVKYVQNKRWSLPCFQSWINVRRRGKAVCEAEKGVWRVFESQRESPSNLRHCLALPIHGKPDEGANLRGKEESFRSFRSQHRAHTVNQPELHLATANLKKTRFISTVYTFTCFLGGEADHLSFEIYKK